MTDDGEAGKADGMQRSDDHADLDWKATADQVIRWMASTTAEFTTDEVRAEIDRTGATTHELRALGARMTSAARAGLIEKGGFRLSSTASRHRAPIQIWQSLILGTPADPPRARPEGPTQPDLWGN